MLKGLLADANVEKHVKILCQLLLAESRIDFWNHLNLTAPSFDEVGLSRDDSDLVVWQRCSQHQLVLVTANRNDEGADSLESAIRTLNRTDSLPVVTLADADRILRDRSYAELAADRLLEYLFDIERYLGTGRLYIP